MSLVAHFSAANHDLRRSNPVVEIVKTRFAKGESDEEEFTLRMKLLE